MRKKNSNPYKDWGLVWLTTNKAANIPISQPRVHPHTQHERKLQLQSVTSHTRHIIVLVRQVLYHWCNTALFFPSEPPHPRQNTSNATIRELSIASPRHSLYGRPKHRAMLSTVSSFLATVTTKMGLHHTEPSVMS